MPTSELINIVAFHDPCVGESDNGDYAAIIVAGRDQQGFMYVLDAYIGRCPVQQQIEEAMILYERWRFNILLVESNNFQVLLKHEYNIQFKRFNEQPRVLSVHQTGNKELRISNLQPLIASGDLVFNQAIDAKLIEQLAHFPTANYDDGPDALEGAISRLIFRGNNEPVVRRATPTRRQINRRPSNPNK